MNRLISREDAAEILQCTAQTISNWVATGVLTGHVKNGRLFVDSKTIMDNLDTAHEAARTTRLLRRLIEENKQESEELRKALHEKKLALRLWNKGMTFTMSAFTSILASYRSVLNGMEADVLQSLIEYNEIEPVAVHYGITPARVVQIASKAIRRIGEARSYDDMKEEILMLRKTVKSQKELLDKCKLKTDIDDSSVDVAKQRILSTKIIDTDFSVRTINCLNSCEISTVAELCALKKTDLLKLRNFGRKSLREIEDYFDKHGLEFGMNNK